MPAQSLRAELLTHLVPGFAQRGFSPVPLSKKEAGTRKHLFKKITPDGSWIVHVDLMASYGGISIGVHPYAVIDAIAALLDRGEHSVEVSMNGLMHPTENWRADDGEPILPVVQSMFGIIDSVMIPHFDRYASPAGLLAALTPFNQDTSKTVFGSFADSYRAMTAIAAAFLLGRIEDCDRIALEASALWKNFAPIHEREFLDLKHDFYDRHLRPLNVKPDAWLLPPEVEARRRAEHPPKPGPRPGPSPSIWIDGTLGAEVPARFEYGYELRVIGTKNREFVQTLTEVAHKLTTGKYALMMVVPGLPGKKPDWDPRPLSYRKLVIDGKWALDWTPPPPPPPSATPPPARSAPATPSQDPNPDSISITNRYTPGWSPFYFRTGYAMYPNKTGKLPVEPEGRELVPTLTEVAARLRSGAYTLMMSHDRTGTLDIFLPNMISIDGKPAFTLNRGRT